MLRVFVVDDSGFVRKAVTRVLASEPTIRVVGEASNGLEALERIPLADPDVVTLDIAMPGMDGLHVLRKLLLWKPSLKVLMLSAHTQLGAKATIEALAVGAVDFIDKTTFSVMDLESFRREVVEKLKVWTAVGRRPDRREYDSPPAQDVPDPGVARHCEVCVIGASTGGPMAIQRILESIPARFPMPVAIVQHMPTGFTRPFAARLNSLSALQVAEAIEGDRLRPGRVIVARAGAHLRITPKLAVLLPAEPRDARHIPSIDFTMKSAVRARPGRVLGILLTGMGDDGADGLAAIRTSGGFTIGQSEASCAVYGMPRAAHMRGAVDVMLSLPEIVSFLGRLTSAFPAEAGAAR